MSPRTAYSPPPHPGWWARTLAHPYETALGAASIVIGITVAWAEAWADGASQLVEALPDWQVWIIAALHLAGGVMLLAGVHWRCTVWRAWQLQTSGLILSMGAWASWLLAAQLIPGSAVFEIMAWAFFVGHGLRWRAVAATQQRVRLEAERRADGP